MFHEPNTGPGKNLSWKRTLLAILTAVSNWRRLRIKNRSYMILKHRCLQNTMALINWPRRGGWMQALRCLVNFSQHPLSCELDTFLRAKLSIIQLKMTLLKLNNFVHGSVHFDGLLWELISLAQFYSKKIAVPRRLAATVFFVWRFLLTCPLIIVRRAVCLFCYHVDANGWLEQTVFMSKEKSGGSWSSLGDLNLIPFEPQPRFRVSSVREFETRR